MIAEMSMISFKKFNLFEQAGLWLFFAVVVWLWQLMSYSHLFFARWFIVV